MGRLINRLVGLAATLAALAGTGTAALSASQEELSAWEMAKRLDTPEAYQMFLEVYPDSDFTQQAFAALADSFASEAGAGMAQEVNDAPPEVVSTEGAIARGGGDDNSQY